MKLTKLFAITIIALSLWSCAPPTGKINPDDPLETYNRVAFHFNSAVDLLVFKPTAELYVMLTPAFLQKGIYNMFDNANNITTIANDILQLKPYYFLNDSWRLFINSTAGFVGFFDVASKTGLEKHRNDFGLTLARWGYKNSTFIVIPIWGPKTIRDTFAIPADFYMSLYGIVNFTIDKRLLSWILYGVDSTRLRAELLQAEMIAKEAALDRYTFERNAFLQRRRFLIQGRRSDDPYIEEFDDEEDTYIEELDDEKVEPVTDTTTKE